MRRMMNEANQTVEMDSKQQRHDCPLLYLLMIPG